MSITIRHKKLADGRHSLYLDIYESGKRSYEFLELYLDKDTANEANRKSWDCAIKSITAFAGDVVPFTAITQDRRDPACDRMGMEMQAPPDRAE